ncbi:unnamed protein product [Gordionus sp. m RMFG-2023]
MAKKYLWFSTNISINLFILLNIARFSESKLSSIKYSKSYDNLLQLNFSEEISFLPIDEHNGIFSTPSQKNANINDESEYNMKRQEETEASIIARFTLFLQTFEIKLVSSLKLPTQYLPKGENIKKNLDSSRKILVQYFSSRANNNSSPVMEEQITLTRDACIYEGYVDQETFGVILFDSTHSKEEKRFAKSAVFNLCGDGLMGMFQIDGKQFFIEPVTANSMRKFKPRDTKISTFNTSLASLLDKNNNHTHQIDDSMYSNYTHVNVYFLETKSKSINSSFDSSHNSQPHIVYSLSSIKTPPFDKYNFLQDSTNFFPAPNNATQSRPFREDNKERINGRPIKKRSVSREHFVEIMIVADYDVAKSHGPDLQRYILTIISIVEMIYKNPSIGNAINIVLVKIAIFQDSEYAPKITGNGETTLGNFCDWQYEHNTKSQFELFHHDTAILLTRQDICSNEINCQTLAMTRGSICDPTTSCAIAEDNGLSVALTIAHEIGHNLGLPHDGDPPCKEFESYDADANTYHIMSKVLYPNNRILSWSKCSQHYISSFLDKGFGQCLLNKPENMEYMSQMKALRPPGEEYSLHQQCQLIYGSFSHFCPNINKPPCQYLYCLNKKRNCDYMYTQWADGTSCGYNKWCQNGNCIDKIHRSNIPIDGGWGEWSEFTPCSRSCGGGVMTSSRTCTDPIPANNGRYCLGRRSRAKSCNTQECLHKNDFRNEQCAKFNGNNMGILGIPSDVKWIASYEMQFQEKCKLYCRAEKSSGHKLANKVIDGTPCDLESTQICIQGICRSVGCDQVLGSRAEFDKCGVCGGDNSTCHTVVGSYNLIKYGYNNVGRIPVGAMNIDIRQYGMHGIEADDNYLALRSDKGEYLINGGNSITMTRLDIKYGPSLLQYTGSNTAVERINSTGMIKSDLIIQVLTVGHLYPPDIRYSYDISTNFREKVQVFTWNIYGPWNKCSCKGKRSRKVLCINTQTFDVEPSAKCDHLSKPLQIEEKCDIECNFSWKVLDRTPCSVTCGHGFQKNIVVCLKIDENGTGNESIYNVSSIVSDSECRFNSHKPAFVQPCFLKPCSWITHWSYTPWSSCSASCGGGIRTRQATCIDSSNRTVGPHYCNSTLTVLSQICRTSPCPTWHFSQLTTCSKPCGKGVQSRSVWCQQDDQRIDSLFCPQDSKPNENEICESSKICMWNSDPWTECIPVAKCGNGYKTRSVHCLLVDSKISLVSLSSTPVNDNYCLEQFAQKPATSQNCYSECISSIYHDDISNDIQQSGTSSLIPKTPTFYHQETKYDNRRKDGISYLPLPFDKNNQISPNENNIIWKIGSWTMCSQSCGLGLRERVITCIYKNGTKIYDEKVCELYTPKPAIVEQCKVAFCGLWRVGSWQKCSNSCGKGTKNRYVACVLFDTGHIKDEIECDPATKPIVTSECSIRPCINEQIDNNKSDQNIDVSNRLQIVKQIKPSPSPGIEKDNKDLPYPRNSHQNHQFYNVKHFSSNKTHPSDLNTLPGLKLIYKPITNSIWRMGTWSQCSVKCGNGWKRRLVLCQNSQGAAASDCDEQLKPINFDKCFEKPCYIWKTSDWSRCNKLPCQGIKTRTITCTRDIDNIGVHESFCAESTKPVSSEECLSADCQQMAALTLPINSKLDYMIDINNNLQKRNRPIKYETPSKPQLYIGPWSSCSKICGKGIQSRVVECRNSVDGEMLILFLCLVNSTNPSKYFNNKNPISNNEFIATTRFCRSSKCLRWKVLPWSKVNI